MHDVDSLADAWEERLNVTYGHPKGGAAIFFAMAKGRGDISKKSEVLQGTLDLMILKTL